MSDTIFDFIGGDIGAWEVIQLNAVVGDSLEFVSHVDIRPGSMEKADAMPWALKGIISNLRYTEKQEKESLVAIQADLGRPEARSAALIPIRKSKEWWLLAQDERRKIFENKSHHTQTGLKYLPQIARKLYHCRDIGEPFDFLTWFEYDPAHSEQFEELVYSLRKTEEWNYVEREIDIRMMKHT
jgi:chlorite dismutase